MSAQHATHPVSVLLLCDDDPGHAGNVLDHIGARRGIRAITSSVSIPASEIAARSSISRTST